MVTNSTSAGIDPVEGLIGYINDIKPYHSKIIEILIEYVYGDSVNTTVTDKIALDVAIDAPSSVTTASDCNGGFSVNPYGDPTHLNVVSPNHSVSFDDYPAIDPVNNTFIVSGNSTGKFLPGTKITIMDTIDNYEHVYDVVSVNPGPAGTGSFVITDDPLDTFASNHAIASSIETYASDANVNRPLTITSIQESVPVVGQTTVSVSQAVYPSMYGGKLGLVRMVGVNSGTYTVQQSTHVAGTIDSWPGYPLITPGNYITGDQSHTIVTVAESLSLPPTTTSNILYAASVKINALPILSTLAYSHSDHQYNEGKKTIKLSAAIPSNIDGFGNPIPDSGKLIVSGQFIGSNIAENDTIKVTRDSNNNGTYTITSIAYDDVLNLTTFGVAENVTTPQVDGFVDLFFSSNVFVVGGKQTSKFYPNTRFTVIGGDFAGTYTTLYSSVVAGNTNIRVVEDIFSPLRGHTILATSTGFEIDGNVVSDYEVGSSFNVVGSQYHDGNYEVASVSYVEYGGSPPQLINRTIVTPVGNIPMLQSQELGKLVRSTPGMIQFDASGFSESPTICALSSDGFIGVTINEQLWFSGLSIDVDSTMEVNIIDNNHININNAYRDLVDSVTLDATTFDGEVVLQPGTGSIGTTASASIEDRLDFGWGTSHHWNIVDVDFNNSYVYVAGDITGMLQTSDRVSISGSSGNDGDYEIAEFDFVVGINQTRMLLDNPTLLTPIVDQFGVLSLVDIDVVDWFQFLILEAKPLRGSPPVPVNVFEVHGNATNTIQVNQEFVVMGTSNDGVYVVNQPPVYNPYTNATDIPVSNINVTEKGGWIESLRDQGITIVLEDSIGISASENANGSVVLDSGSIVDAWDYPYWDIGPFENSLATISLINEG